MLTLTFASSSNEDFETDVSFRKRKPAFADVTRPTFEQTDPVDLTGAVWLGEAKLENREAVAFSYNFVMDDPTSGVVRVTATNASDKPGLPVGLFNYDILRTLNGVTRRVVMGTHQVERGITTKPAA